MPEGSHHHVVIQRYGRSHCACCACGWRGHVWNELRPAEADAWHHLFGNEPVIDLSTLADPGDPFIEVTPPAPTPRIPSDTGTGRNEPDLTPRLIESLVAHALSLADSPSPYRRQALEELWERSSGDRNVLRAAVSQLESLLLQHSRRNAHTADSEWLRLITAKRLLQQAIDQADALSYL